MQLLATKRGTITASSGDGYSTISVSQNIIYRIIVKATTSSTVFDVSLENSYGDTVWRVNDIDGEINEEIKIPFARKGTLKVLNSTRDEDFVYILMCQEN